LFAVSRLKLLTVRTANKTEISLFMFPPFRGNYSEDHIGLKNFPLEYNLTKNTAGVS
jgi:hypothetical protein